MVIADEIKRLTSQYGTQAALAEALGVNVKTISNWRAGLYKEERRKFIENALMGVARKACKKS